jgi:hypothetical protein
MPVEWEDVTKPTAWQTTLGAARAVRVTVHRHIDHPPSQWLLTLAGRVQVTQGQP